VTQKMNQDLRLGFYVSASRPLPQNNSRNYGTCGGSLRIGHSQERARVDADELDEEASGAGEDQVGRENFSGRSGGGGHRTRVGLRIWFCMRPCAVTRSAHTPEPPGNGAGDDEFVDGRGMNALDGGDQSVRETHAPGEGGGNSVVTIAGKQTTDSADAVAERGGW